MPSSVSNEQVSLLGDPERIEAINVFGPTIQFSTVARGTIPPAMSIPLHSQEDPETFISTAGAVEGLVITGEGFQWVPST